MMEVVLLERVERLGQIGDVVTVRPGYARNFLLPRKKALRATEENRRAVEERRTQLEADNLERKGEAEAVAAKMEGLTVYLERQAGESGQLYGSVNARDAAEEVSAAGFTVTRHQVALDRPIKALGLHPVRIDLHPEVAVTVAVNVARSEEEAAVQERTGKAVSRLDEDELEADVEIERAAVKAAAEEIFEAPSEELIEELAGDEMSEPDAAPKKASESAGEAGPEDEAPA
jgi:large subunit ribosomal protein L9